MKYRNSNKPPEVGDTVFFAGRNIPVSKINHQSGTNELKPIFNDKKEIINESLEVGNPSVLTLVQ